MLLSNHKLFISFHTNKKWGYFTRKREDNEGTRYLSSNSRNVIIWKTKQLFNNTAEAKIKNNR